jgi:hypothetical protein
MTSITAQDASALAQEPQGPGPLHKRIVDTFFSPGELFARFGADAPWGLALLVATLLSAAAALVVPTELWVEQMREQLAANPEAAAAVNPETMASFGKWAAVGGNLFMVPIISLITAGILVLLFKVAMDGEAGYRQYMAVVSHVAIVGAVGAWITMGVMIASGDLQNQLSLALLVPGLERGTFAFRFLNIMSVFALWQMALYAVAAGAMNRRIATGKAAVAVFAAFAAVAALFAFIGGLIGG